jgi:pilus assembly protein CpaC
VRAKAGTSIARISALILALSASLGLAAQSAPSNSQPVGAPNLDSANELSVSVGKTVLIDCAKPVSRVAIGLPEVAEASAISPTEIMLIGKAAGETSLILWDTKGNRQFFNVTVRPPVGISNDRLESIRRQLQMELPGQPLRISADHDNIFLRGTVRDLNSAARAEEIVSTAGKVINLLNIEVPAADPQILLKVRFTSIDRNKGIQAGINLFSSGFGNTLAGISTGQFSPPSITLPNGTGSATTTVSNELNLFAFLPGLNLGATLEALESRGIAETLAEPNIIASNGKQASFLAGGEFPIPVAQGTSGGSGAITISFKEFGIRLNFIPTITPRGTIRLQVAPEVSALDYAHAVEIGGAEVPALTSRKVNDEVELADGQSFVIGGLLDNEDTESFQKIPFLGDIPFIGKFFQSMTKNKTNTELIVIVTPSIVQPIPAGVAPPELKYPSPFLPPNTGIAMNHPDEKPAGATAAAPPPSIPLETLLDSLKNEKPLLIESSSGSFGTGSGGAAGATTAPAPAPQPAH